MSLESTEVRVGGSGHIWRAAVGTAFPTNVSAAVSETLWAELGYVTEDGVNFSFSREVNDIMGWQSFDPIRTVVTAVPKEIKTTFLQMNQNVWATAMGGGTWTGTTPNFVYEPPLASDVDQFAYIVEFTDGAYTYRFCYRKVQNISGVEFDLKRADPVSMPVTVKVLAADGGLGPFILQTNDANMGDYTQAGS